MRNGPLIVYSIRGAVAIGAGDPGRAGDVRNLVSTTLLQAAWLHDHGRAAQGASD